MFLSWLFMQHPSILLSLISKQISLDFVFCVIQGLGNNVALEKAAHKSMHICNIPLFTCTHKPMFTHVLN